MTLALKIIGPHTGPTGYDHHVRAFVRELHARGVEIELADAAQWGPARLPRHLREPWLEGLAQPIDAGIVLHFLLPDQVAREPGRVNVNFTMFEATRIPPDWVARSANVDLIVLPTESSRQAWIDSGVAESKLRLCPLGVSDGFFRAAPPFDIVTASGRHVRDYGVRFINVSEMGPRKNIPGLLRAWLRATTPADNAILVMKVGCYTVGSLTVLQQNYQSAQRDAGKKWSQAAPVHFIHEMYSDADMPRLFAAATNYISLSLGEGWDLPMTEAAAAGLRLIAPDHSAYATYLDESIAALVPSAVVPAEFPGGGEIGALFTGLSWWRPDEDEAVRLIRQAIEGEDAPRASARERIAERYTWDRATSRLIEILEDAAALTR